MKLSFRETDRLLKTAGVRQVRQRLVHTPTEAAAAAEKIGFPVVMKIVSADILHKTDIGGVVTGVGSQTQARETFSRLSLLSGRHRAALEGILVQQQAGGREVIIGGAQDPQFGPVLMAGLGGIFVEVLKDVAFRLVPLSRGDAREMIRELRGYPLLGGVRGQRPANVTALENAILAVSRLIEHHPRIRELDINPLFVDEQQALAADVRVLV